MSAHSHRAAPVRGRTRLAVGAVALIAVVWAGGFADAYWPVSGTGTGATTIGTAAAVTLSPGMPDVTLHPGGQSDMTLTVSNPNTTVLVLHSLALDPTQGSAGFAVDGPHSACDTAALSFTTQANGGAGWTVPARTGTTNGALAIRLSNALALSVDAANACQGAQFTVYLVAGS